MNESSYWVFLKPVTETVDILNDWAEIFKVYMNIDNRDELVECMKELRESTDNVLKALGE